MEKNMDFNNFPPYMNSMNMNYDMMGEPGFNDSPMFNPIMQYEQAYMYYRYLCQQLEYKIKCKEYEKLCNRSEHNKSERRVE